jgi:hypothetical protein
MGLLSKTLSWVRYVTVSLFPVLSILVLELLDNFDAVKEIFYCAWLVLNCRNIGCNDGVKLCMIL